MKQPEDLPCKWAEPGEVCDMCRADNVPCTGSFSDVIFSPAEMDCYEPGDR